MLVLLVCAPLVALTIHQSSAEKRRESQEWERRANRLSTVADREEQKLLRDTRQLLMGLSMFSGVASRDWASVTALLRDELSRRPQYANLGILDANGRVVASALPMSRKDFSTATFFKRTMLTRNFSAGRVSIRYAGHNAQMDFGFPVYGTNELAGVAFASVDLAWVDRFESPVRALLPFKDAVWTEIDPGGRVVWRHPSPGSSIGRALGEPEVVRKALGPKQGLLEWKDNQGTPMTTAFATRNSSLTGTRLIGILSVQTETLFEQANLQLKRHLMWLATATTVALFLGWLGSHLLIVKPIKALARASSRLAAGEMSVRTGLKHGHDELGQLSLAFDQMAEALEHREQERLKSAKKLQVLSHKLVEVQENERRHIARELHDEIGQALTAAEMNLQAALQSPRAANVERRIAAGMQAVEQVLEQVHDLSLNLRPSMLDDLGLEPALRWLTRRQAELAGIEAEFHSDPLEHRLHPVIETECFRIAQEALTNIVRHAKAKKAWVHITVTNGHLHLRVRDDGHGFDVGQLRGDAVQGASLGLLSMEERAALAGGGISLTSAPQTGTEVHAWFPLRWDESVKPVPRVLPDASQAAG